MTSSPSLFHPAQRIKNPKVRRTPWITRLKSPQLTRRPFRSPEHTMTAPNLSMFSLEGKTALVTGGTRGIGAAMAIALAEAGADIILVQRDENNTSTRDAITALGRKASIYVAELSDRKAVQDIVPNIVKDGRQHLDILINCAGIQRRSPCEDFSDQDWDD
ncbi:hypothetical protein KEM55_007425, partial [Ascosphaera atra]